MTVITTVLYPAGSTFNLDYYLSTHMPLVSKIWGPFGLKDWKVVKYTTENAQFTYGAFLTWENSEDSNRAVAAAEAKPIFDDIPNFSDRPPSFASGDVVGSWEAGN
ncbi:hypothetical protein BJX70DRAFT_394503 [Aspergillus crustosus]